MAGLITATIGNATTAKIIKQSPILNNFTLKVFTPKLPKFSQFF
ncbi:hypothetical protein ACFOG5_12630 [Pedobacter fastidiosus]